MRLGFVLFHEIEQHEVVLGAVFAGQEGEPAVFAGEAVLDMVLGGDGFAGRGFRAAGPLGVLAVGGEAGGGDLRESGQRGAGFGDCENRRELGLGLAGGRGRGRRPH